MVIRGEDTPEVSNSGRGVVLYYPYLLRLRNKPRPPDPSSRHTGTGAMPDADPQRPGAIGRAPAPPSRCSGHSPCFYHGPTEHSTSIITPLDCVQNSIVTSTQKLVIVGYLAAR
jgi:hypothetical protein